MSETYLRCMCSDRPHMWSKWLALVEFWYNSNFHTSIQMTPFEEVYGQPQPQHLHTFQKKQKLMSWLDHWRSARRWFCCWGFIWCELNIVWNKRLTSIERKEALTLVILSLLSCSPIGNSQWCIVLLKSCLRSIMSLMRFVDLCGKVAYKLRLPTSSRIHYAFHVSQLNEVVGNVLVSTELPNTVKTWSLRNLRAFWKGRWFVVITVLRLWCCGDVG